MSRFVLTGLLMWMTGVGLFAQVDLNQALKALYTFDRCDGQDDSGNNSTGQVTGAQCQCGVSGESLFFDGKDDRITFDGNINEYFKANNFTISFYFKPASSTPNTVLLSKYDGCTLDTGFLLRYGNGSVAVQLKGISGVENALNVKLKSISCWTHLALVRRGSAIELYENGELIGKQDNGIRNTDISNSSPLSLAMDQCATSLNKPFRGNIDQLAIYNQPLSALQIKKLLIPVDAILTQDTVVAVGKSFIPTIANTCAADVRWEPATAVSSPTDKRPVVTVSESTTIKAFFNYGNCIAVDSIRVRVVDSDQIDCENIPMPRAFTPNGDGLNDTYYITLPGAFDELISFDIFNKWNELIFRTTDPSEQWNGTFDNQRLNPGGYLYKIRYICSGKEFVKTGEFLLMN